MKIRVIILSIFMLLPAFVLNAQDRNNEKVLIEPNEIKPSFDGGDVVKFQKWVEEHRIYPEEAKMAGIEGRVTLQFTITKEGKLTNVKLLRGVHPLLDQEAIRVIESAPQKWTPGLDYKGEPKDVTYTYPMIFSLPKE